MKRPKTERLASISSVIGKFYEVIDHPWINSFSFRININKLLVNHCVNELEQTKNVIEMLWYIPNRNCNQHSTSITTMQTIKSH